MKRQVLSVLGLACCLGIAHAAPAENPEILRFMLQGESTAVLSDLVRDAGGIVTHELPIINAVGADLNQKQLERLLESPVITRHILENDPSDDSEEEEEAKCRVRGHIELEFAPRALTWELYNKKSEPASARKFTFSWPEYAGRLETLYLGETQLYPSPYARLRKRKLVLKFPRKSRPVIEDQLTLKAEFSPPPKETQSTPWRQRDFYIVAKFAGGCVTDLVPGYENNDEDYYYNSVSGIDLLHRQGITGKGVTVAVIDSGLWEHPNLLTDTRGKDRIPDRYDALLDVAGKPVQDESGHGTHMTSIIAHSGATIRDGKATDWYKGAAPDANLVPVKVLDREGRARLLDIVRAVQWVVDNREKYGIRVLNMSFAQLPKWPYWDDPVNQAVMRAWKAGITVVAAAGNEGPDPETIGSPANLPYIISVGAVTDSWTPKTRDDDYIPDFSSQGPTPTGHVKPDIVAPGGHMTGLINADSALATTQPEDILRTGEFVSTGSSQAAALVSGMLALLIQLEPELTPDELKCKLTSSAEPAINQDGRLAYSPFQQGYGYVNIQRAITLGRTDCRDDTDLDLDLSGKGQFYGPALEGEDGAPTLPDLEAMLSDKPSEKGMSKSRKWGVKDHIERRGYSSPKSAPALDWEELYRQEKEAIERLANPQ